jgi:hypothetical protein
MGRGEPGDSQPSIIHEWGGVWVVPGLRWGWFELSSLRGVNNLHAFAIVKKKKRRMRILSHTCCKSYKLFLS